MDFLRDPIWQFILSTIIPLVVGIVGIAMGIWAAVYQVRKQHSRREITYEIISNAPIASVNETMKGRVSVFLDNKRVEDARLLVLKVWNSGKVPIERTAYEQPVKFVFEGARVIGGDVLETVPPDLITSNAWDSFLTLRADTVELPECLLNEEEAISFTVLLTNIPDNFKVTGRIIAGKIVDANSKPNEIRISRAIFYCFLLILTLIVILLIFSLFIPFENNIYYPYVWKPCFDWLSKNHDCTMFDISIPIMIIILLIPFTLLSIGAGLSLSKIKAYFKRGIRVRW